MGRVSFPPGRKEEKSKRSEPPCAVRKSVLMFCLLKSCSKHTEMCTQIPMLIILHRAHHGHTTLTVRSGKVFSTFNYVQSAVNTRVHG